MATVERTVTVDTALPTVWAYLHDFSNAVEWDPPTVSCERTSGDGGLGTTYHNVSKLLGKETSVDYEVVDYVEYRRLQLKGDAGSSLNVLDTITFSQSPEGGTSVTYRAEFLPTGAAKLAEALLPPALQILAQTVASSLEKKLASL